MEHFHSRGQDLCKYITTNESVYIRKEINSRRIGLGHQRGLFSVLGHQHGRRDVMWKHSTGARRNGTLERVSIACSVLSRTHNFKAPPGATVVTQLFINFSPRTFPKLLCYLLNLLWTWNVICTKRFTTYVNKAIQ